MYRFVQKNSLSIVGYGYQITFLIYHHYGHRQHIDIIIIVIIISVICFDYILLCLSVALHVQTLLFISILLFSSLLFTSHTISFYISYVFLCHSCRDMKIYTQTKPFPYDFIWNTISD